MRRRTNEGGAPQSPRPPWTIGQGPGKNGEVLAGPTEVIGHDDAAVTLTADVTGVQQLSLVVTDGGDGNGGSVVDAVEDVRRRFDERGH